MVKCLQLCSYEFFVIWLVFFNCIVFLFFHFYILRKSFIMHFLFTYYIGTRFSERLLKGCRMIVRYVSESWSISVMIFLSVALLTHLGFFYYVFFIVFVLHICLSGYCENWLSCYWLWPRKQKSGCSSTYSK